MKLSGTGVTIGVLFLLGPGVVGHADLGVEPAALTVNSALSGGLHYLQSVQAKESKGDAQSVGEWPSAMSADRDISYYSRKKSKDDSNLFTTAWTHNLLAEIYLRDPSLVEIPPMLTQAIQNLPLYRDGDAFRFWKTDSGPAEFDLQSDVLRRATDLFPDADDTAVAYTAEWLYQKVTGRASMDDLPDKIGPIFSQWRDRRRKNFNLYNLFVNREFQSGAFLTWLGQEQAALQFRLIPEPHKHNMPFGENDIDCIVNTNVLIALAERDELDTPGADHACNFINRTFRHGRQGSCGVYYPNHYQLHAELGRAIGSGVNCLDESRPRALKEILERQHRDGSWLGTKNEVDTDITTGFALSALAEMGDASDPAQIQAASQAIDYLLGSAIQMPDGRTHWGDGAFFSGGTVVRTSNNWRSKALTTALVISALQQAQAFVKRGSPISTHHSNP